MSIKLLPVNKKPGGNRWCGPAVISALTGITTDQAAREIREATCKRSVTRTGAYELLVVLKKHGLTGKGFRTSGRIRPTLAQWLKDHKEDRTPGRVFLILAGDHWQLVSGRKFVCGLVEEPISIRDKRAGRRRRVAEVWEIIQS